MNARPTQPLTSSWSTFACRDGFQMRAFTITPRAAARSPRPGVLFVYEPFGINTEMQRVAGEIAAAGYTVMIPDLLQRGRFLTCMRQLMRDLRNGNGRGVDDLLDARAALAEHPDVDPERLGVVGLCLGGGFALILATTGLFQVAAPFYGQVPDRLDGACPIVASYGGRDRPLRRQAERLRGEAERLGVAHDIQIYPDAGHSFMNRPPNRIIGTLGPHLPPRARYHEPSAHHATRRLLDFFADHLDRAHDHT